MDCFSIPKYLKDKIFSSFVCFKKKLWLEIRYENISLVFGKTATCSWILTFMIIDNLIACLLFFCHDISTIFTTFKRPIGLFETQNEN